MPHEDRPRFNLVEGETKLEIAEGENPSVFTDKAVEQRRDVLNNSIDL